MRNLTKTGLSLLLSVTMATPAMAQHIVFNGQHNYKANAVNIDGRFFLTVADLNELFRDVYGLDVYNYEMFFDTLEPAAVELDAQTFVPVRAFSEAMGWDVDWIDGQVFINFPDDYLTLDEWLAENPHIDLDLLDLIDETHYNEFTDIDLDALLTPTPELPVAADEWIPWWLPQPEPVVIENPQITGALHRVTYGDNVAYIFGSFHLGLEHWFPLADIVEDAIDSADVFAFEANFFTPDEYEWERVIEVMEEIMFLPDNQTWVDVLPQELYDPFVAILMEFGLNDYEEASTLNPAMIIQDIALYMLATQTELDTDFSVDAYVGMLAFLMERPIIGLATLYNETLQAMGVSHEVMLDMVADFIGTTGAELNDDEWDMFERMIVAYETNDLDALRETIAYGMFLYTAETPHQIHTRDIINFTRSIQFGQAVAQLLQETADPTTFFVTVGISHVIRGGLGLDDDGITNVIAYLQHAGFEVEALY